MIGFGKKRPKFVLKKDTSGFQEAPQDDKGEAVYMFWFTGNTPRVEGYIQDANAGTFYSAVSNIDFQIEEGNPAAVVMRAHFAQHGFVSHCVFDVGQGKAGIFDVGNEMESLVFLGGRVRHLHHQMLSRLAFCPGGKRLFRPAEIRHPVPGMRTDSKPCGIQGRSRR